MRIRSITVAGLAALLAAGSAQPARAQRGGAIEGTIRAGGAPLPNAHVVLRGAARATVSDARGRYRFAALVPGSYVVVARAIGRVPAEREADVTPGATVMVDVELTETGVSLSQVVVTADRAMSDIVRVPASVTIIDGSTIETRAALQPGDELVGVSSVRVTRPYEGETAHLTIRGVPNRHANDTFLALVDGVPMVTGNDEVDMSGLVPLSLVERVEVVKGPVSPLYGRGGISGAINYITRAAVDAPRLEGGIVAGSYGLVRPFLAATLGGERGALLVSALAEQRDGRRANSDRSSTNLFAKHEWTFSARTSLATTVNWQEGQARTPSHIPLRSDGSRVRLPGGEEASYQIPNSGVDRRLWLATGRVDHRFADALTLRTTLHARGSRSDARLGFTDHYDDSRQEFVWNGFRGITDSRTYYAESQIDWRPLPRLRVITGGSLERVTGDFDEYWTGQYGFDPATFGFDFYIQRVAVATGGVVNADRFITDRLLDAKPRAAVGAAYAQADLEIGERARLSLGARWDRFDRGVRFGVTTENGEPQGGTSSSDRDRHVSPKISLDVALGGGLAAWASFSEGFSPAFGPVWAFRGRDTSLEPEIARNFEVGLKGNAARGRALFTAALYQLVRTDLLQLVPNPGGVPRPANAGEQRSQGLEIEARGDLTALARDLSGWLSYTWTDSKWVDNTIADEFGDGVFVFSGKQVANVPRHLAAAGLTQRFGALTLGAWVDATGRSWLTPQNTIRNPSYVVANASITWALPRLRAAALLVTATNVADTRYYTRFADNKGPLEAYPGQRREVIASVRWAMP